MGPVAPAAVTSPDAASLDGLTAVLSPVVSGAASGIAIDDDAVGLAVVGCVPPDRAPTLAAGFAPVLAPALGCVVLPAVVALRRAAAARPWSATWTTGTAGRAGCAP